LDAQVPREREMKLKEEKAGGGSARPGADKTYQVFVDGASRGNPGNSAAGYLIKDGDTVIEDGSKFLGVMTNNQAEYRALILALERCVALGLDDIIIKSDSQLMVRQLNGIYRVREPDLVPVYNRARQLMGKFKNIAIEHIGRSANKAADKVANSGFKELRRNN